MKKRMILIWMLLLIFCTCLWGCTPEKAVPDTTAQEATQTSSVNKEAVYDAAFQEVTQLYIAYKERAMVDWQDAVQTYCYFNDEEALEKTLEGTPIFSYEIIRVEKYSDQLWEVEFFSTAAYNPEGAYGVNYVAMIDGEYRVVINLKWVPEELLEGLEIEPYIPHGPGIVGYEDVIGGIGETPEE